MFETSSRYYSLTPKTLTTSDGRKLAYLPRRFLPQGSALPLLAEIVVTDGDRLDLITYRTLGDPQQFWRVCDANDAMNPTDLTAEPGRRLRVPVPQA